MVNGGYKCRLTRKRRGTEPHRVVYTASLISMLPYMKFYHCTIYAVKHRVDAIVCGSVSTRTTDMSGNVPMTSSNELPAQPCHVHLVDSPQRRDAYRRQILPEQHS